MLSIQILIVFMIVSAFVAVESRNLYASVMALGLLGLELSLVFLLLKAPDLAIILLVLEMITLFAVAKTISGKEAITAKDVDLFSALTFSAFAVLFVIVCLKAFLELPQFGYPIMKLAGLYTSQPAEKTGFSNIVASIALHFRGLDSLATIFILFLSAAGIAHVAGKNE